MEKRKAGLNPTVEGFKNHRRAAVCGVTCWLSPGHVEGFEERKCSSILQPPNGEGGAHITKAGLYLSRRGFSCGQKLLLLLWRHKKFESWKLKLLACLQLWLMLRSCINQKHDLKKYRKIFLEKETLRVLKESKVKRQSPKLNFFFFCLYLYRHKRETLEIEISETVSNEPGGGLVRDHWWSVTTLKDTLKDGDEMAIRRR